MEPTSAAGAELVQLRAGPLVLQDRSTGLVVRCVAYSGFANMTIYMTYLLAASTAALATIGVAMAMDNPGGKPPSKLLWLIPHVLFWTIVIAGPWVHQWVSNNAKRAECWGDSNLEQCR